MSKQLYLAHQVVAMEAGNPLIPGMELFGRIGPSIASGFHEALSTVRGFFSSHENIPFDNSAKQAEKSLAKLDYAGIMDIPMPVPEGFIGNIHEYGILLSGIVIKLGTINGGLNDVIKNLSIMVSNPSMAMDSSKMAPSIGDVVNEMDVKEPLFAEYLDPHRGHSTLPFGKLVARNKDWSDVVETAEKLQRAIATLNKKDTLAKAGEIERLLDKAIAMYKVGKFSEISGDWLEQLSGNVYHIATLLEWYSVIYYRSIAYLRAVQDIGVKLNTIASESAH